MIPSQIIKIKDHSPKTSDIYFFDNNIWMYLFCPLGNYQVRKQKIYSRFLENLLSLKIPIFINSLVLSEFTNRYLKLDYNLTKSDPTTASTYRDFKKDFVGSAHYRNTVVEVKKGVENILKITSRCGDEFNSINIPDLLNTFTEIGFNDSYYIQLARKKKWIIVSDDSDFTNQHILVENLFIVTA